MKNGIRQVRGQSLVEFALVVPILILIIVGTFDLGFAVYADNTLSLAAREGARYAVTRRTTATDADICQRVSQSAAALTVTCTVTWTPGRTQGSTVSVTATANYTPLTPVIGNLVGSGGHITLTGKSSMYVE